MADTGHRQPPGSAGQSSAPQAGTGSAVRSGRPGFLDVGVHGLREPLAVLSQQVCRGGREDSQSASVPTRPPAAGQTLPLTLGSLGGPILSPRNALATGHPPWSNSHLGFFLQAASKASRQSAFSATRALRRFSVLGCSLQVGCRTWGVTKPTRWHHCQACPGTAGSPLPSIRLGVLTGWKDPDSITSHHLPPTRPPRLLPHVALVPSGTFLQTPARLAALPPLIPLSRAENASPPHPALTLCSCATPAPCTSCSVWGQPPCPGTCHGTGSRLDPNTRMRSAQSGCSGPRAGWRTWLAGAPGPTASPRVPGSATREETPAVLRPSVGGDLLRRPQDTSLSSLHHHLPS